MQNQLATYPLRGKSLGPDPGASRKGKTSPRSPKKERKPYHNYLSRELSQTLQTSAHSMFGRKEFTGLVQAAPLPSMDAPQKSHASPTEGRLPALQLADKPPLPQLAHAQTTTAKRPPQLKGGEASAAFQRVMKTRERKKRRAAAEALQPAGELRSALKQQVFRPSPGTQKIVSLVN